MAKVDELQIHSEEIHDDGDLDLFSEIDNVDEFVRRWEELKNKKNKAVIFIHDPMSAQSCTIELYFDMTAQTYSRRKDDVALKFLKVDYSISPLRSYLADNHKVTMAPMCLLVKEGQVVDKVEGAMPTELKKKIDKLATEDKAHNIFGIIFHDIFSK